MNLKNTTNRENIFIENDEEIPSIINKIKQTDAKEVALVIPRNSSLTQGIVNLKILKKQIHDMKKEFVIITTDKVGINLANQLYIKVFSSLTAQTPEDTIIRSRPDTDEVIEIDKTANSALVSIHHFQEGEREAEISKSQPLEKKQKEVIKEKLPQDKPLTVKIEDKLDGDIYHNESFGTQARVKHINLSRIRLKPKKIWLALLLILLVLGCGYLFTPRAQINLVVLGEEYQDSLNIEATNNTKVPLIEEMKIPGQIIEMQKDIEGEYNSSGTKNVGEKTRGKVTLKNSWHQDPQSVVAGTVLEKDGLQFITTQDATVPGATLSLSNGQIVTNPGIKDVLIEAKEAGEKYNTQKGIFEITGFSADKRSKFFAENSTDLAGGSTREIKVVSLEDLEDAKQKLTDQAKTEIIKELQEKNPGKTILDDAVEYTVLKDSSSHSVNTEIDKFKLTIIVKAQSMAFEREMFKNTFITILQTRLPEGKDLRISQDDEISSKVKELDIDDKKLILACEIKTRISPTINQEKLTKAVLGKKLAEAKDILEADSAVEEVRILISPSWLAFRLPYFTFQYQTKVEHNDQ